MWFVLKSYNYILGDVSQTKEEGPIEEGSNNHVSEGGVISPQPFQHALIDPPPNKFRHTHSKMGFARPLNVQDILEKQKSSM